MTNMTEKITEYSMANNVNYLPTFSDTFSHVCLSRKGIHNSMNKTNKLFVSIPKEEQNSIV
ncbi:MAG: hypothetical protein KAR20_21515 [Candidatus Heimdallarchaeota archaeon]|nr:hypothetical protein [Candidatus Heimdallarchaeota archaeon]